jgi:hypothetical protein
LMTQLNRRRYFHRFYINDQPPAANQAQIA